MTIEIIRPLRHLRVPGSKKTRFISVQRQGTRYDLGDSGLVEIFRVGVFCEAVDRSRDTVIQWEKDRLIPRPLFAVHGERWRYYHANQLINVNRLALGCFHGRRYLGSHEDLNAFFDDVWACWFKRDVVVDEDGVLDRDRIGSAVRRPLAGSKPIVTYIDVGP